MKRVIEGTQETVLFYVDDIKLSHANQEVLLNTVKDLVARYGKVKDLTITRGDVHEFLGMTQDFGEKQKLKVIMKDYVEEVIDEADEALMINQREKANIPAKTTLFNINAESPALNKKDADHYHRLTAKLLYLAPRAPSPSGFLDSRFLLMYSSPMSNTRRLGELFSNPMLPRENKGFNSDFGGGQCQLQCYVDSAHMLHHDFKGHKRGYTSFGVGPSQQNREKQRLNSCSSCETELIGTDDYLKQITWARNFMLEQGYNMQPTILYQDNESTITNQQRASKFIM